MVISQVVARRFMLAASGLAVYAAVITSVSIVLGDDFIGWGSVVDVVIFLGLAYGGVPEKSGCCHLSGRLSLGQSGDNVPFDG
jgi:hypothetical protein